jgi:hypothetical protein
MSDYYAVLCDLCHGQGSLQCSKCDGSGMVAVPARRPGLSSGVLRLLGIVLLIASAIGVLILVRP